MELTLAGEMRIPITHRLFLDSSAVEQLTVNQLVAGSNPARGAISTVLLKSMGH